MNAEQRKECEEIMRQILIAYPNYERFSDERKDQIWQEYMFCLELNLLCFNEAEDENVQN